MAETNVITVGPNMSKAASIADAVTSLSISHTMDLASSLQFTVHDKDFAMLRADYFQLRQQVYFRKEIFEIVSFDVAAGPSGDPQVSVECLPRAIQKMRRDKKPRNYGSTSSYDYVKKIANEFNLYFIGQPTAKTQSIPQAKNEKTDESVWDVVTRLAGESEYVCFVASIPYEEKTKKEGVMFFISQKKLLKTWGPTTQAGKVRVNGKIEKRNMSYLPIQFPSPDTENNFVVLEMPTFRKSENDWREAEGSVMLWNDPRGNAQMIRPGMTVKISNYARIFNGYYIITAVEWSEDKPGPVKIAFRTPELPKKEPLPSEETSDTLVSSDRQKNLAAIRSAVGEEVIKGIVGKSDKYIEDYAARIKASAALSTTPYTDWVD